MAKTTNPAQFLQEVRTEASKVTWPTRRETMVTTIMVFIMVVIVAVFFLGVDQVLGFLVQSLIEMDLGWLFGNGSSGGGL
ncbi:MAG: preprotein translocase subunit SecE [Alphaproteobacteria bacterium]